MPAAVRLGDICTGHDLCGSRPNAGASKNVFINSRGAHRIRDPWTVHCLHSSTQASGSPNVFVNGRNLARIGDVIACGSSNATGSPNVFANG